MFKFTLDFFIVVKFEKSLLLRVKQPSPVNDDDDEKFSLLTPCSSDDPKCQQPILANQ